VIPGPRPRSLRGELEGVHTAAEDALRHGMAYADPGASYYEERYRRRVLANLRRRAKSLGYVLQTANPTPTVAEVS
jgi:transposase